jgi:SAM-dependent methyltransferase
MKHFDPSSRSLLSRYDLDRFVGPTLFDRLGRALCGADCLPRKEFFESWEVARRVRRRFRGGRVVDLACGHGLAAAIMLLLDPTCEQAVGVDQTLPASANKMLEALRQQWPRLSDLTLTCGALEQFPLQPTDVVISIHACGALSDQVLERAISARCRVAILPCCHDIDRSDIGGLGGWLEPALAIDVRRAERLRQAGYAVHTQTIPVTITPKNRLLLGTFIQPPR